MKKKKKKTKNSGQIKFAPKTLGFHWTAKKQRTINNVAMLCNYLSTSKYVDIHLHGVIISYILYDISYMECL